MDMRWSKHLRPFSHFDRCPSPPCFYPFAPPLMLAITHNTWFRFSLGYQCIWWHYNHRNWTTTKKFGNNENYRTLKVFC
jgi:hypothetical protein